MSTLYVVATPIGNLEDITLRALRILQEVDIIACEDTRTTNVLLHHFKIKTKTISYHSHTSTAKESYIIELLRSGKNVALVSDAGTPTISDPGVLLVARVYHELENVQIIPIPGPNAAISTLSASGLVSSEFIFLGFLPHKKGRKTLFDEIANTDRTVVFYESPHRLVKTLSELLLRIPTKTIVVGREVTKKFETITRGSVAEVATYFNQNPDKVRGEFTICIGKDLL